MTFRVCMVGTGYVGLTTGVCFAEMGRHVVCVDKDADKIAALKAGRIPIYEPGLEELTAKNVAAGRITFVTDINEAFNEPVDFVFIAVGTPTDPDTGAADLTYVYAAAEEAAQAAARLERFVVFANKSTVPVGTARKVSEIIGGVLPEDRFAVASNPEFLREGCAIKDFLEPDRIVVGSDSALARALFGELYRPLTYNGHPLFVASNVETAELIKYAANAFLATKIGFINEIALLCDKTGADVGELASALGMDHRIGKSYLKAGPGYGGSCFPKDTLALAITARDSGAPSTIVEAVISANERQKKAMADKVIAALGGDAAGKEIAVLGAAFKADTDDMRDAASLTIVPMLHAAGARTRVYDPVARHEAARLLPESTFCDTIEQTVNQADACVILTEWRQFLDLNWRALREGMKTPLVVDTRNLYDPARMAERGVRYVSLGRPETAPENQGGAA